MSIRFFSTKDRPFHLGPYPLERLKRTDVMPDLSAVPRSKQLDFRAIETPHSLVNAMGEYQAMMDAIREGVVNPTPATAPSAPQERSNHMKAFGYFQDTSMIGICELPTSAHLAEPMRNPDIDRLAHDIRTKQTKTLASGIDQIMAALNITATQRHMSRARSGSRELKIIAPPFVVPKLRSFWRNTYISSVSLHARIPRLLRTSI